MQNQTIFLPSIPVESPEPFVLFESEVLDQNFILSFANAVMDFNPIHCDLQFASAHGLPNTAAHGMLSLSFFEQALRRTFGEQWRLRQIDGRFIKMLFVGQTVTGFAQVVRLLNLDEPDPMIKLKLWAQNNDGVKVLVGNAHMTRYP